MRSEFQFFMAAEDQDDFLDFARPSIDKIDKSPNAYWDFIIGDSLIQFRPCRIQDGDLISGRISVATHGWDKEPTCKNGNETDKIYKKFRRWLKKRYSNKLTARNIYKPEICMTWKYLWLGPHARKWEKSNNGFLKSIPGGPVVFESSQI